MENVEFVSHIDKILKGTEESIDRAAEIIAGMMETKAKLYITDGVYSSPETWYIRTGNLRNSITHAVQKDGGDVYCVVGSAVEYAPYVELGTGIHAEDGKGRKTPWVYQDHNGEWHQTSGIPPRPYLRPAVENHINAYKEVLQAELSKG